MRDAALGVQFFLQQLIVREARRQLAAREVINENLIRATTRGELPIARQRHGVHRIQPVWQRLPRDGQVALHFAFRALFDPQFHEAEFLRRQIRGPGLVARGRHDRLLEMRGKLENQALVGIARDHGGAGFAALENVLRRLQDELLLGLRLVVAREAISLEQRQHLALEIHGRSARELGDFDRLAGLGGTERRRG